MEVLADGRLRRAAAWVAGGIGVLALAGGALVVGTGATRTLSAAPAGVPFIAAEAAAQQEAACIDPEHAHYLVVPNVSRVTGQPAAPLPPVDSPKPSSILEKGPFEPHDKEIVDIYPNDLVLAWAPDPGWTEDERVAQITQQFKDRLCRLPRDRHLRGWANFQQALAQGFDVRHAAALAILTGIADPVVDAYLKGEMVEEVVDGVPTHPGAFAQAQHLGNGKIRVVFNQNLRYEDFLLTAPILVHEVLHHEPGSERPEEIVARLLDTLYSSVLVARFPEISQQKTALSRAQMRNIMGILFNSRTMIEGRGELFPGAGLPHVMSWYASEPGYRDLPDTPTPDPGDLLEQLLRLQGAEVGDVPAFTRELLESLDIGEMLDNSKVLTYEDIVRVAEALTLDIGD